MIKNFLIGSVALACFFIGCGSDTDSTTSSSSAGGVDGSGGSEVPCDGECQLDNAFAVCLNDECVIEDCLNGFADCNSLTTDGCEVNTSNDPLSCGSCTNQCFVEGATEVCLGGSCGCQLDAESKCVCDQGLGDCDTSRENGCESDLTGDTFCGACGVNCKGSSQCQGSSCQCNFFNGVEVNDSCGSCLETNCCDEMAACQGDATCMKLYNKWRDCHLDPRKDKPCYWHCNTTNTNLINLRSCWENNQCGCGFTTNSC